MSDKPSKPPKIYKNGNKTGGFTDFLAHKSPKTPFFAEKYLTKYNHETFFEEYMNFKFHYLTLNLTAVGGSAHTLFKGI